jgi:hypothetical protein
MSRFVKPAEVRIPISQGDYLIVKEKLNAGEQMEVFARLVRKGPDDEGGTARPVRIEKDGIKAEMELDPLQAGLSTILAYLVDWSLTDDDGRIVSIRHQPPEVVTAALHNLEFEDYQEILEAVQAHEAKVKAARQEKKRSTGSPASDRTSPSLVGAIGGTNG